MGPDWRALDNLKQLCRQPLTVMEPKIVPVTRAFPEAEMPS
jgi:hypothetical protein